MLVDTQGVGCSHANKMVSEDRVPSQGEVYLID